MSIGCKVLLNRKGKLPCKSGELTIGVYGLMVERYNHSNFVTNFFDAGLFVWNLKFR
mgnify:CR=1 FL=1